MTTNLAPYVTAAVAENYVGRERFASLRRAGRLYPTKLNASNKPLFDTLELRKLLKRLDWRRVPSADPHAAAGHGIAQPHHDSNRAEVLDRYRQPTAPVRPNPKPRERYPACPDCDHGDCPTCRGNGEIMEAGQPVDCPCCCGTGDCRGCDGLGEVVPLDPDAPASPEVQRMFGKLARKFLDLHEPVDPNAPASPKAFKAFSKLVETLYRETGIVLT